MTTRGLLSVMIATVIAACGQPNTDLKKRIEPVYDQATGRLQLLKYDSDGDGIADTFTYMDGRRVIRIEVDRNHDGRIDRWEYYNADQTLSKIGISRADDGREDAWIFPAPDGSVARIEVSTARDSRVNRVEYYDKGVLVRAEEDTDGDGRPDKWETYDGQRLAEVAFDTMHRGSPDRRLVYGPDGSVRIETQPGTPGR